MKHKQKYQKNALQLGNIVNSVIAPIVQTHGAMTYAIFTNWAQIIGDELAHNTQPEKFIWHKPKIEGDSSTATMNILTDNGGTALKLQHMETHILSRINAQFGWRAVTAIKIKQTLIKPNLQKTLPKSVVFPEIASQVSGNIHPDIDPNLAESLQKLGQLILHKECYDVSN